MTDAELLEAVQEGSTCGKESEDEEESEPQALSLTQKMEMVDSLRAFIQETGMQTAMPVFMNKLFLLRLPHARGREL